MEAVLFIGIQAVGKSTFYKEYFFNSHVRISMDLLKTRNREKKLIKACLETSQKIVIDNTNPTEHDRKKYIELFKQYNYKIIGYYFESKIKDSLARNSNRLENEVVSEKGILGTYNRLEIPDYNEGFDILYYVSLMKDNRFDIKEWNNEI